MPFVYFQGQYGVLLLDRARIIGAQENRTPTEYPTRILIDCPPLEINVRNGFDDVQSRLMYASATTQEG